VHSPCSATAQRSLSRGLFEQVPCSFHLALALRNERSGSDNRMPKCVLKLVQVIVVPSLIFDPTHMAPFGRACLSASGFRRISRAQQSSNGPEPSVPARDGKLQRLSREALRAGAGVQKIEGAAAGGAVHDTGRAQPKAHAGCSRSDCDQRIGSSPAQNKTS